jgi:hypothetical protein
MDTASRTIITETWVRERRREVRDLLRKRLAAGTEALVEDWLNAGNRLTGVNPSRVGVDLTYWTGPAMALVGRYPQCFTLSAGAGWEDAVCPGEPFAGSNGRGGEDAWAWWAERAAPLDELRAALDGGTIARGYDLSGPLASDLACELGHIDVRCADGERRWCSPETAGWWGLVKPSAGMASSVAAAQAEADWWHDDPPTADDLGLWIEPAAADDLGEPADGGPDRDATMDPDAYAARYAPVDLGAELAELAAARRAIDSERRAWRAVAAARATVASPDGAGLIVRAWRRRII